MTVVGVGQVVQRDLAQDAIGLMVSAARAAADDAGVPELLARVDEVLVPEGMWQHGDAGRLIARRIGAPGARTLLARIGILQTTPFARAVADIGSGAASVVLVVGGESRARFVAAQRDGGVADETLAPPEPADDVLEPHGDIVTEVEILRGLALPAQSYAVQESALGDVDEMEAMWDGFQTVARANPHAWDPEPGDRMIATPYTRRHVSQWNVDMAAAVLLCSEAVADELGIAADRRVHPIAIAESNAMITVSARRDLDRSPAFASAGRAIAGATGIDPAAVDHLELYSCFPSAVRIQARELEISLDRRLTVTGGMAFAGGPLNSSMLHGLATMVDVLRAEPGTTGMVNAISGMITKQGVSIWSTEPRAAGPLLADVTDDALAETATVEVDAAYAGEAVVEGVTVAHDRNGPSQVIVLARTPADTRAVATWPVDGESPWVGDTVWLGDSPPV